MGMQVNTNLAANNAYRNLSTTQNALGKSMEKLSSGLRINRAADDAAGLAISEGLKSQVNGYTVAARNAQDGISVVQTAEGSLTQVQSILQRMRDLAVQAGNDSNNDDSRGAIKKETTQLTAELTRMSEATKFNGKSLLDGSTANMTFQVGADGNKSNQISVNLANANVETIANTLAGGDLTTAGTKFDIADISTVAGPASFTTTKGGVATTVTTADLGAAGAFDSVDKYADALRGDASFAANFTVSVNKDANGAGTGITVMAKDGGVVSTTAPTTAGTAVGTAGTPMTGGLNFETATNAQASLNLIDTQIKTVSAARADLGAVQNRLESAISNLNVGKENLSAATSRITDVDMASEMVDFTRSNILAQAGTAMLAQANQSNQGVLKLLG
ncbi:flagellin N-terminal helical domain-containing protein [Arthrobacter antibioticus]|uniref:flagellin N-terminal helical domain-containing protein n=1 Tax=Arthrobacter sp. H35-MC1 TaxID=3046203 RepID=UPI0024B8F34A|nr:flagellin [Arthrobacter sp. H35-MC1]MDJ0316638.1 flagellin [Arthrobacter sp. H35-MC1]